MKKIFTLCFCVVMGCTMAFAQDDEEIDNSYEFVSKTGEIIPHGSVVILDHVEAEEDPETGEVSYMISTDFEVKSVEGFASDLVRISNNIIRIDNGGFATCALGSCIPERTTTGQFYSSASSIAPGATSGDLQTEWIAYDYGMCVVEMQIEIGSKVGFGNFKFEAYGPKITVQFVNADPAKVGKSSAQTATVVARYSLDGRKLSAPQRGVNILHMSDGTTRKMVMK